MKRKLLFVFCLSIIFVAGCSNSDKNIEIDADTWTSLEGLSVENEFHHQLENAQYISDLQDFISPNILSLTENVPFASELKINATFDKNSSVLGGLEFSQQKTAQGKDYEKSEIVFDVQAASSEDDMEPFNISGSLALLYQQGQVYAQLHDFNLFMGEGNMTAKMYSLIGDMLIDKWVDLESDEGGIISVSTGDARLPYIMGNLVEVLETEEINESQIFLGNVSEVLDLVNSYIDLGISTDYLKLIHGDISYFEFSDGTIQKIFTGEFQGQKSEFSLSFITSKRGLEVHLYDIKEYDEDLGDYKDMDSEFIFSIQEEKKSEYAVVFQSIKYRQKVVDFEGKIKYGNSVEFSANFVLEPLEIISGQKISGKLNGSISNYSIDNVILGDLPVESVKLSDVLSSL